MRTRSLAAVAVTAAVAIAGCSSDNSSSSSSTTASPTATTATTTAPEPTTTVESPTTTEAITTTTALVDESVKAQATAALLTAAEVGADFTTGTYSPGDPKQPGPCGTPSVESTVPSAIKVGTVIELASTGQSMRQEIAVYGDPAEADAAFGAGTTGLTCPSGTAYYQDGTTAPLSISGAVDVTADVGGDQARAWQVQTADVQGVVIAVKMQGIVVTFQFQAPAGVTTSPPLPATVAKAGMDKVIAS